MLKTEAIQLLGGTIPAAAKAIGVSYQAVDKWPEVLPDRIADRVQAFLYRQSSAIDGAPEVPQAPTPADAATSKAEATNV